MNNYQVILLILGLSSLFSELANIYMGIKLFQYNNCKICSGYTGRSIVKATLEAYGIKDIVVTPGDSNSYDFETNVMSLSEEVIDSDSISAISIAMHECGHAMQDAENYGFILIKDKIFPVCRNWTKAGILVIIINLVLNHDTRYFWHSYLFKFGILFIAIGLIVYILMVFIECDASKRAVAILQETADVPTDGSLPIMVTDEELTMIKKIFNAITLMYIAQAASSVDSIINNINANMDNNRTE